MLGMHPEVAPSPIFKIGKWGKAGDGGFFYLNKKSVFGISGIGMACEYRYAPVG
jgi:hypothetical protein